MSATPALISLPIAGKPKTAANSLPDNLRMIICGLPKGGKSTMAATANKPLALDFEKGRLDNIDVPRISPIYLTEGVDVEKTPYPFNVSVGNNKLKGQRFKFLIDWLNGVYSYLKMDGGENVKTVLTDTTDSMMNLMLEMHVADFGKKPDQRQTYKAIYNELLPILRKFTTTLPQHQIYISHVSEFMEDGATKYVLSMPPELREFLASHVEIIGMITLPSAPGAASRFVVKSRKGYPTGDGTGKLNEDMPSTMQAVYAHWTGEDPEDFPPKYTRYQPASEVAQPVGKK